MEKQNGTRGADNKTLKTERKSGAGSSNDSPCIQPIARTLGMCNIIIIRRHRHGVFLSQKKEYHRDDHHDHKQQQRKTYPRGVVEAAGDTGRVEAAVRGGAGNPPPLAAPPTDTPPAARCCTPAPAAAAADLPGFLRCECASPLPG
jgi:hypothetical protein